MVNLVKSSPGGGCCHHTLHAPQAPDSPCRGHCHLRLNVGPGRWRFPPCSAPSRLPAGPARLCPARLQGPVSVLWGRRNHRLHGFHNRHLFSRCSGAWKPRLKEPAGSASGEDPPLNLQVAAFSLFVHMAFPQCLCVCGVRVRERESLLTSLLIRSPTSPTRSGPHLLTSLNSSYFLTGPHTKYSHTGDQGFDV